MREKFCKLKDQFLGPIKKCAGAWDISSFKYVLDADLPNACVQQIVPL